MSRLRSDFTVSCMLIIAVFLAAGCTTTAKDDPEIERALSVADWRVEFNNAYRDGRYYFAGAPTLEGLRLASEEGVEVVVDLLAAQEQPQRVPFDEAQRVQRLGMAYHHIPVTPETFSVEDVDRFAAIVSSSTGPILVHCSSSNRAGGLWAAYLHRHRGYTLNEAIDTGMAAGLRRDSMIQAVRRVAETSEPLNTAVEASGR